MIEDSGSFGGKKPKKAIESRGNGTKKKRGGKFGRNPGREKGKKRGLYRRGKVDVKSQKCKKC